MQTFQHLPNLFYHDSANLYGQYLTIDVFAPFPVNANIPTSFNLFYHDSANLYGQYLTTDVSAPPFPPNPMLKETTPTVFVLGFFLELVLQNIFNIGLGGRVP